MTVEVVFIELDPSWDMTQPEPRMLGRWQAQLLQPGQDRESGLRVRRMPIITEDTAGWFSWVTHGINHAPGGGTRYHSASSLTEAQAAIQSWAKRRFSGLTSVEPSPIIRS